MSGNRSTHIHAVFIKPWEEWLVEILAPECWVYVYMQKMCIISLLFAYLSLDSEYLGNLKQTVVGKDRPAIRETHSGCRACNSL
jgi:hypothetical protein